MGIGSSSASLSVRISGDSALPPLSFIIKMGFRSTSGEEHACLFELLIFLRVRKRALCVLLEGNFLSTR